MTYVNNKQTHHNIIKLKELPEDFNLGVQIEAQVYDFMTLHG